MIQVIFAIGAFLGLIVISLMSDIKGRKPSLIVALVLTNLAGICNIIYYQGALLGGQLNSLALLLFSQFCGGFGAYSLMPLTYAIFSDFCSDKLRQQGVVLVNAAWYYII